MCIIQGLISAHPTGRCGGWVVEIHVEGTMEGRKQEKGSSIAQINILVLVHTSSVCASAGRSGLGGRGVAGGLGPGGG